MCKGVHLHNMYMNTALWGIHLIFAEFLILMLKKIPSILFTKKENINKWGLGQNFHKTPAH